MKYLYLIIILLFAACTAQKEKELKLYRLSAFKNDSAFPGNIYSLQTLYVNDTIVLLHWSIDGGKTIREKIVFLNKDFYTSTGFDK